MSSSTRFTFEDTSPFLTFSPGWHTGSSSDDKSIDLYSESSCMETDRPGETMSFSFYGSEVAIYGARRANHGAFEVLLDGTLVFEGYGPRGRDAFRSELFRTAVEPGDHTITLRNAGNSTIDVDYVSFRTDGDKVDVVTLQDKVVSGGTRFEYTPSSAWSQRLPQPNGFFGGTGHFTSVTNASVVMSFEGSAVALYGPVGPAYASAYSVSLNGGSPQTFSAKRDFERNQQLLYIASGLDHGGSQELKVSFLGGPKEQLGIDFANIYRPIASSSSSSTRPITHTTGFIVGVSIASAVALILLATFAMLIMLWIHRRYDLFPSLSVWTTISSSSDPEKHGVDSGPSPIPTLTEVSTQYASTSWTRPSSWAAGSSFRFGFGGASAASRSTQTASWSGARSDIYRPHKQRSSRMAKGSTVLSPIVFKNEDGDSVLSFAVEPKGVRENPKGSNEAPSARSSRPARPVLRVEIPSHPPPIVPPR